MNTDNLKLNNAFIRVHLRLFVDICPVYFRQPLASFALFAAKYSPRGQGVIMGLHT